VITAEEFEIMKADYRKSLDEDFAASEGYKANKADWLDGRWSGMKSAKDLDDPRKGLTGVDLRKLKDIWLKITKVPKTFARSQNHCGSRCTT
jgi:2-oxoglutarate dehydrogenase E1 component